MAGDHRRAEVFAFGGPTGMSVAHNLFHRDSQHIVAYLGRVGASPPPNSQIGRREVSMLLCSLLMREAGQEWYEQGDVWAESRRTGRRASQGSTTSYYPLEKNESSTSKRPRSKQRVVV